ncbi:MAG: recombinase [Epulopiscium sp.]|nr:recombinase [Candidatus Epulonipiscium sp.]
MNYEEYEMQCKQQQEKNDYYLEILEKDMVEAGLTDKTIRRHLENVDFYINTYLLREAPLDMQKGCGDMIDMFLGYFFIYKCMWSTPGTIKKTAASIKKFYKCMKEHGYVSKEDYNYLCTTIKENMQIWQKECKRFNKY